MLSHAEPLQRGTWIPSYNHDKTHAMRRDTKCSAICLVEEFACPAPADFSIPNVEFRSQVGLCKFVFQFEVNWFSGFLGMSYQDWLECFQLWPMLYDGRHPQSGFSMRFTRVTSCSRESWKQSKCTKRSTEKETNTEIQQIFPSAAKLCTTTAEIVGSCDPCNFKHGVLPRHPESK